MALSPASAALSSATLRDTSPTVSPSAPIRRTVSKLNLLNGPLSELPRDPGIVLNIRQGASTGAGLEDISGKNWCVGGGGSRCLQALLRDTNGSANRRPARSMAVDGLKYQLQEPDLSKRNGKSTIAGKAPSSQCAGSGNGPPDAAAPRRPNHCTGGRDFITVIVIKAKDRYFFSFVIPPGHHPALAIAVEGA